MDLSKYGLKIFSHKTGNFESLALEVFRFQYTNNPVYRDYVNALSINVTAVTAIAQIPFLPIRFFKSHLITTTLFNPKAVFESSGTTGSSPSRHLIRDIDLYKTSFTRGFEFFYGSVKDWCIIGLLPSYLERKNSSLVYMVNDLIKESNHLQSGFYLNEYDTLSTALTELEKAKQNTILIGVTFALLDFGEKFSSGNYQLQHTIIMETGGMKGRKEEMIRTEVHDILKKSFGVPVIHSEYGMTEILSQAYSKGNGIFHCPPWMRVLIRDDEDPLSVVSCQLSAGKRRSGTLLTPHLPIAIGTPPTFQGAINIIDLANIYSCSFIATDDAGKLYPDGSFEVLGRINDSDIRGCSLMVVG